MKPVEQVARAICAAPDIHLSCGYPDCSCQHPKLQAKAAIQALIDAEWNYDGPDILNAMDDYEEIAKAMLKQMIAEPEK